MYGILRSFNLKLTNQIKANTRAGLLLVKYYTYHIWTELSFSADLSLLASPLLLEAASSSPCFLLISVFGFCKHVTRIKYSIVNFFWRFLLIYHPCNPPGCTLIQWYFKIIKRQCHCIHSSTHDDMWLSCILQFFSSRWFF